MTALAEGRVSAPARRRRRPFRWGPVGRFVGLAVIIVMFLGPIVWMVLASFKLNVQIYDSSQAIIFEPTLENYGTVFDPRRGNYLVYIWNSFFIAFMATGLSLVLAVPAAYAMSRFLMNKSATTVLLARIIPGVSLLVPWYYIFAQLRMTGSFLPLILSHMFVSLPLILYIMMSFFDQMPEELEESAQVDGLTPIQAFFRITLPLSISGIATATILSFIFSWNNFMFALVLAGPSTKTLPVAIFDFIGYASIDWGALMAASVVVTTPIMLIALFTQRYIVSGLTAGATKG
ncbi:carbohydrate ABC transporter permease [Homoserinibacter gongjuensis]|uniref:Sugar ABC transporter permease n=1 Tax=Homoserinibacter gongjuensis TaxID=1162968 RepID=A0ABQ6JXZ3_9MICO|nr:carbohydrate ABC transporter permease [Homoserinibacter gongjuensis]GMA91562.1 sugar ABC transporter permease [Homoserinibacter gongjuensis]HTN57291.1 carbohydrate ABC transporter permease [Protaetiibacter sp.]